MKFGARFSENAARDLRKTGAEAVVVKGGHLAVMPGTDVLATASGIHRIDGTWIDSPHTHGTGCVYASAAATFLAAGVEMIEAIERSKRFTESAIRAGRPIGAGAGAVAPGSYSEGPG